MEIGRELIPTKRCHNSGSLHGQKRFELSLGQTGIGDPHAELGGGHGGPDTLTRDHRQQRMSVRHPSSLCLPCIIEALQLYFIS